MTSPQAAPESLPTTVLRIQAAGLAMVFAFLGGAAIFVMTAWLLLKGGLEVGPHLSLLSYFLPGYSVTWGGALVGLAYGSIGGGTTGWLIATIYNRVADLRAPR